MNRFFAGLSRVFGTIFFFLGRLFRDIVLEVWRPIRRQIVRWTPIATALIFCVILYKTNPRGAEAILQLILMVGIMGYGFKILLFGRDKKKKN